MNSQEPLWRPSPERISTTRLTAFVRYLEASERRSLGDYSDLHRWSVQSPADFWRHVWTFCGVIGQLGLYPSREALDWGDTEHPLGRPPRTRPLSPVGASEHS